MKSTIICPECGLMCPVMAKIYDGQEPEPTRQDAYCPKCQEVFTQLPHPRTPPADRQK